MSYELMTRPSRTRCQGCVRVRAPGVPGLLLVLVAALLATAQAQGTTYYVRTIGDDSNPGTSPAAGSAWATIQKAATTMVAGDVVYVGSGTYTQQVAPSNDGTLANPIRFIADTDGAQTGDAGPVTISVTGSHAISVDSDDYIEFVEFRVSSDKRAVSWDNSTGGLLQDCDIDGAGDEAVYILGSDLTMTETQVSDGKGVYCENGSFTMKNCLVHSAMVDGIKGKSLSPSSIWNSIIEENNSGGIYLDGGNLTVTNSIIVNNNGAGLKRASGTLTHTYNLVFGNSPNYDSTSAGVGEISVDPLFWGASDYHLQRTSPAIDAGTDATGIVDIDLDGSSRPSGTTWEMGVYEGGLYLLDHAAGQESDAFTESGGETDAELFGFKLDPGTDTFSVTQLVLRITAFAGLPDSDWAGVEIVVDSNDDGDIGVGETTTVGGVGVVNQAAGTITFSTSFIVASARNYILRADFGSLSDEDTVTIDLNSADMTVTESVLGSTTSVVHSETIPLTGFNWLTTAFDISLSTTGSWQDIDLSSYVPVGTTGAVVELVNTGTSSSYSAVVRGKQDTRDYMSNTAYEEFEGETHRWQIVEVDSNRFIQGYIENTGHDFKLVGYTHGPDPSYFVTPPDITPASGAWTPVDVSGYVDADARGVILFISSIFASDADYAIREVSSSFSATNWELEEYGNTVYLVGIDGSDQFDAYIQNSSVKIYLVGQTKTSVVYVDDIAVSDPPLGSWQELDADDYAIPAPAEGLIFRVVNTDITNDRMLGLRHGDSSDNWNKDIGNTSHFQAGIGIRADNVWDEYLEASSVDVFITAYTRPPPSVKKITGWRELAPQ